MKNHQSSTISKKKQRKVFIISLLLQNEEHRPLKIFPEQPPAKEKEEEKNCKKIQDTFLLSQNHKSSFNSFQEKNEKKRKQIKANPLEEQQSRNDDFPWCIHIGTISPDPKDVPRILKVRGGAAYRVFGRLSVRVNTRQCPPFVRPVYRRCLPNKSLYTVGASLSLRAPPLPHANDTPSCLWNRRPLYKGGGYRDERRVNGDAKYFTMEHVRAHRPRRRSTRRVERTRHRAYAYSGWRLRDELLGNVGPSLINDGTE